MQQIADDVKTQLVASMAEEAYMIKKSRGLSNVRSGNLLCCPFCGREPKVELMLTSFFGPKEWVIGCFRSTNCPAGPKVEHRYRSMAIKQWNRRATSIRMTRWGTE